MISAWSRDGLETIVGIGFEMGGIAVGFHFGWEVGLVLDEDVQRVGLCLGRFWIGIGWVSKAMKFK